MKAKLSVRDTQGGGRTVSWSVAFDRFTIQLVKNDDVRKKLIEAATRDLEEAMKRLGDQQA